MDDSTAFDVLKKSDPNSNELQNSINKTVEWTVQNDMKINAQKTHEMIISFAREKPDPPPISIDDEDIARVDSEKLVGLNIQSNLKWDIHITEIVKKAKKKLYFLLQMKRSKVPPKLLVHFFRSVVVPQLEHACPVWTTSITEEQKTMIESVQQDCPRTVCHCLQEL